MVRYYHIWPTIQRLLASMGVAVYSRLLNYLKLEKLLWKNISVLNDTLRSCIQNVLHEIYDNPLILALSTERN